jgi:Flp pilus assembly protein TadG
MPRLKKSERGANLVEMAFVAPFLILLLFGIIEFAWVFAQDLTVKHGAREGARLAAVTFGADTTALIAETKGRMNISDPATVTVCYALDPTIVGDSGVVEPGDGIEVTVFQPRAPLTGIMDWALSAVPTLTSTVEIRAEQTPTGYWTSPPACP